MIGKNIRKLREILGLSQKELATAVGIARPIISQIESGSRKVSADELPAFSRALNASVEQLLGTEPLPRVSIAGESRAQYNARTAPEGIRISVPRKNLNKFREVLLYILDKAGGKPNIGEAVIYKLLYFIDFDFYEKFEEQLVGATYIKNHYGPTPVEFKVVVDGMIQNGEAVKVKGKYFNYPQKKYLAIRRPNLDVLSGREIKHIDDILARLSDKNAKEMENYSHGDIPWRTAEYGKPLSYESVFYRDEHYSVRNYEDEL